MEPGQSEANQAGREDLAEQSIAPYMQPHYLLVMHQVVKGILQTFIHLELRHREMRFGALV